MISGIVKKYVKRAFFLSVVLSFLFVLFGMRDVCRGVVLGSFFSVFNFSLLSRQLHSRLGRSGSKASSLAIISMMFRYLLMSLPLFLSFKFDELSTLGVVIGLFTVHLGILFDHLPQVCSSAKR